MNYIVLSAIILTIIVIIITYQIVRSIKRSNKQKNGNKDHETQYLREILSRDQKIHTLETMNNNLNKLNDRYLSFMIKIPIVVQRLNTTLKVEEVISSIIQLVSDIIPTNKVELYYLDITDNLLKKISSINPEENGKVTYAIGEGLIGMAAQHRMIKLKKHFDKTHTQKKDTQEFASQIWMAVPIIFKDRLFGVIGIGQVKQPVGNESDIMKMIADIAGVALINQAMLGEAKEKANTDSLTGLNNRYYFLQVSQAFVEKAVRESTSISFFMFDIDNFKHYNDTNGHNEGDRLLKELSDVIRGVTRKNAVIVRYGGEEFLVMLPGISKEDAFIYAERLREKVSTYPFAHREKQPLGCVSISGGVASFPNDGDTIFKIIQLADESLYKAKSEGRNRVIAHKPKQFSGEISDNIREYS